jgi:AraC family transcriptional regulator of adaptative response/methylated-DNA-[protein]-cysteine methyltransferase
MNRENTLIEQSENYRRIEGAIRFLEDNFQDQPSLDEIAASVHLSKYHFQRLFKRWAGVTPTQFLGYLTVEYAKERLKEARSLFDASLDAGLSGPGRLHDLFVTFEAMTPGEFKQGGTGIEIAYGFHPTPFGESLLATTDRGIAALRFFSPESEQAVLDELKSEWWGAKFTENPVATEPIVRRLFCHPSGDRVRDFRLLLKGTNFQIKVWQALLAIPPGAMVSYQDLAGQVASPSAARAVANAIARNPIAYLIPCHRVISKVGKAHRYRWGAVRKKAMLGWEASRYQAQSV